MRVEAHPILGALPPARSVGFRFAGRPLAGREGEPIAAALLAAGIRTLRRTRRRGEPRGIYCGIGHCFECRLTVDGCHGVRSCLTPLREGMEIEPEDGAPSVDGAP